MTFLFSSGAFAADFSRVDQDLAVFDQRIAVMKAEFSKTPAMPLSKVWVQSKLKFMFDIDQDTRHFLQTPFDSKYSEIEKTYFMKQYLVRINAIDDGNTADLKELMKIYPWFKISEFGVAGDNQAWIIVQHADRDPDFQKKVLVILESLYPKAETSPSNYALLYDRVQASWNAPEKRQLQRYGSQGQCVGPALWEPLPMEDPANVDQRRAAVDLEPMVSYKVRFKDKCH